MHKQLVGVGAIAGLSLSGLALAQAAPGGSSAALPPAPPDASAPAASASPVPAPTPSAVAPTPAPPTPAEATPYPAQPPYYAPYPPQQGYGYPPGYAYPPPVYYAPERPRPRYPDDAAAQASPFFELLVGGVGWDKRFSQFFNVGMQAGLYLGGRVRVTVRGLLLTSEPNDDGEYTDRVLTDGFVTEPSDSPSFLYGASLGFAGIARRNFVFSPGIAGWRSDVSDYGSFLGLSLPFEWVTDEGARFGFEFDVGRAFGGTSTAVCEFSGSCTIGTTQEMDRDSGTAIYGAFQFGWGLNHPEPKLPPQ